MVILRIVYIAFNHSPLRSWLRAADENFVINLDGSSDLYWGDWE